MATTSEVQAQPAKPATPVWLEFWTPWVVFSLLSGTQLLSMAQAVWVELNFTLALERILEANVEFLRWVSGPVEPLAKAAIDWLNFRFGWRFVLHEHWRPLAALALTLVMSTVRGELRYGTGRGEVTFIGLVAAAFAFLGALLAGLMPLGAVRVAESMTFTSLAHSVAAAVPLSFVIVGFGVALALNTIAKSQGFITAAKELSWSLRIAFAIGVVGFILGFILSFSPYMAMQYGAGLIALALLVALFGVVLVLSNLGKPRNEVWLRVGLSMLGGFAVAAIVWSADLTYRALSA